MSIHTAADIKDLHASFGTVPELIEQRRAVYSAAIELTRGPAAAEVSDSVLENPAVRAHLGAVLAGITEVASEELVPVDDLVVADAIFTVPAATVRVASSSAAVGALAPALARITGQLQMHGDRSGPRVLVESDPEFGAAVRAVREGVRLALRLSPVLVSDLLPHVALIAVLARAGSGRLGSASSRDHPGLVMVPEPQSPLELAEALVHEGAHQKFFDLAITRSLIGPDHMDAPYFMPPWASAGAPPWSLEQCFAAFHAYVLLSAFNQDVQAHEESVSPNEPQQLPSGSLLPAAEHRARTIGAWMVDQGEFLGADGRTLVWLLHGVRPSPSTSAATGARLEDVIRDADVVRSCGGRTLIARAGSPVELYWVTAGVSPSGVR